MVTPEELIAARCTPFPTHKIFSCINPHKGRGMRKPKEPPYDLTFDEAMRLAKRTGNRVRRTGMGAGWTVTWFKPHKMFYCINPHKGTEYGFTPTDADKLDKWRAATPGETVRARGL